MMSRSIFSLSAITVLALAWFPGHAVSQQKPIKDQLVGTWMLVASENVRTDGTKVDEYGPHPKGTLIFDSNGRYSVTIMRADLPKFAAGKADQGTTEENQAVMSGLVTHFGTYSVNEADKILTSHIEASSFPNNNGIDQRRVIVSLTADELRYGLPVTVTGTKAEVLWKRTN
jgi:Lipocalin-like domain